MHEIAYDYLNRTEESIEKNNYWLLRGGYNEYSTKADIVTDYLYSLRQLAEKAEAFVCPDPDKKAVVA